MRYSNSLLIIIAFVVAVIPVTARAEEPYPLPKNWAYSNLPSQTQDDAFMKSYGCVACHTDVGTMHRSSTVHLGCTDCHGGNAGGQTLEDAHVVPRFPNAWRSSGNPIRSYTLLNHESPEFVRFVNPGDLRVAHIACGQCHEREVLAVRKSMMTHGCMLWGSALYNNGAYPKKWAGYGESYSMCGTPQRMITVPAPTFEEMDQRGVRPYLDPLSRFEISQPGNVLRIFERGGRFRAETGIPERLEESGRPRERLSNRGLGTENRTDPVYIGLQKTRLLDPTLNFLGTNDHPGDYRSSGCSACHVMYANDRSLVHSGSYAKYGHEGLAADVLCACVRRQRERAQHAAAGDGIEESRRERRGARVRDGRPRLRPAARRWPACDRLAEVLRGMDEDDGIHQVTRRTPLVIDF
jgi:hypothetical protein